jgi:hypothetical protein
MHMKQFSPREYEGPLFEMFQIPLEHDYYAIIEKTILIIISFIVYVIIYQ